MELSGSSAVPCCLEDFEDKSEAAEGGELSPGVPVLPRRAALGGKRRKLELNKSLPGAEEQSRSGPAGRAGAGHGRAAVDVLLFKELSWLSPGCWR